MTFARFLSLFLLIASSAYANPDCDVFRSRTVVADASLYELALQCAPSLEKIKIKKLAGRVLKGKTAEDFSSLTNDPTRKIIFVMEGDGLKSMIGVETQERFQRIGYTQDYVAWLKKNGMQIKLVVFSNQDGIGRLATWKNVVELASQAYPKFASKIQAVLPELKNGTFQEFETESGYTWSKVDELGAKDPRYMNEERFEASEGKSWQVRAFLYHRLRLTELFAGDGYSRDEKGNKTIREYIMLNQKIDTLPGAKLLSLD